MEERWTRFQACVLAILSLARRHPPPLLENPFIQRAVSAAKPEAASDSLSYIPDSLWGPSYSQSPQQQEGAFALLPDVCNRGHKDFLSQVHRG